MWRTLRSRPLTRLGRLARARTLQVIRAPSSALINSTICTTVITCRRWSCWWTATACRRMSSTLTGGRCSNNHSSTFFELTCILFQIFNYPSFELDTVHLVHFQGPRGLWSCTGVPQDRKATWQRGGRLLIDKDLLDEFYLIAGVCVRLQC